MGIIKISIFQKSMQEALNLSLYKKLAGVKSDFLVFPEFFYADSNLSDSTMLVDKSQYAIDWLQKLSDSYKGAIIGGALFLTENEQTYAASPILSGGSIVDSYKKRNLSELEGFDPVQKGEEPGIYMLAGQRFGILLGNEVLDPAYYEELADQDVRLIFAIRRIEEPEKDDTELMLETARKHNLFIVQCNPTGSFLGQKLKGRSMVIAPTGISWRVAPHEEDSEIVKTVMVNLDH